MNTIEQARETSVRLWDEGRTEESATIDALIAELEIANALVKARLSNSAAGAQPVPAGYQLVPMEPTTAMVSAYLEANKAYWERTDELPKPPHKWRLGTPFDATINSYKAMLAAAPVQSVVKDSLTTQEPTPLEVRLVDTLLGQAQEPFAPDWAGYRQGKADGIAEAQEQRKPLSDEQIRELRRALPYGGEDKPEPWAFEIGVRAAERHHGIKEQP